METNCMTCTARTKNGCGLNFKTINLNGIQTTNEKCPNPKTYRSYAIEVFKTCKH